MAKRSGGKRQRATLPIHEIEQWLARLDSVQADDMPTAAFEAVARHLAELDPDAVHRPLARLVELAAGDKARQKALRRAAHRLGQRGIDAGALEVASARSSGIQIAPEAEAGAGLPVLLAPIEVNAVRRFSFAVSSGPGIILVEVGFKARELFRLQASPSNRPTYRRWANEMSRRESDDGRPERVRVPPSWLARKLWEMGCFVRDELVGTEVDRAVMRLLVFPKEPPPHPVSAIDLSAATPLPFDTLAQSPHWLAPFYHGSAMAGLRQQWYELGGGDYGELERASPDEAGRRMERPVAQWAAQWGLDRAAEVILDTALSACLMSENDVGRTLRDIVDTPNTDQRNDRIRAFLLDIALLHLLK